MRSLRFFIGLSMALVGCRAHVAPHPASAAVVTEYRNGQWFDGQRFVARPMWVAGEVFVEAPPAQVSEVVDLEGGFVIPPFGDAHAHWLEPQLADAYIQTHLRDGIYYVKDQSTPPRFHDTLRPKLGGSQSVDYIAAHQGFTGPGGHPIELVHGLASMGILPAEWAKTDGEAEVLFSVSSEEDIAKAWPRLMEGRPDFVKVFLVHSDEYARRRDDRSLSPRQRGIDPALVPVIVARAHAAKLRVSAHIENAHDFHVAVAAGVDEIAHMPFVNRGEPSKYVLDPRDLRAAAARGCSIATTLDWIANDKPSAVMIDVVRTNLAAMRREGNTIVIGTDLFRQTARVEAELIAAHQLMSNLELLQTWSTATPQAIFPGRKLGRLADGFEASFLVLASDPIADFAATRKIVRRIKQGRVIVPGEDSIPPLRD